MLRCQHEKIPYRNRGWKAGYNVQGVALCNEVVLHSGTSAMNHDEREEERAVRSTGLLYRVELLGYLPVERLIASEGPLTAALRSNMHWSQADATLTLAVHSLH